MSLPNYLPPIDENDHHQDEDDGGGAKMGFLEHLDELRSRLIRSCIAVAAGMAVSAVFVLRLADAILASIERTLPRESALIYTRPGEGFAFYFDVALMSGLVLAAPLVSYQVWRFIAPGLRATEKRLVVPFVLLAAAGAAGGAVFAHFILFPSMMSFFSSFDSPRMRFLPRVDDTFALYKNIIIGMVGVFQIPTLIYVLGRLGIVTPRFLWQHLKYAVLVAVVAAALLTPSPDPWNQLVFAAPMVVMYVIGIGIAWIVQPRGRAAGRSREQSGLGLVIAAGVFEQARRRRAQTRVGRAVPRTSHRS